MVCALEQIEKNKSKLSLSKNCQVLSKETFIRFRNKAVNESIHSAPKLSKEFLSAEAETWDRRNGYKAAKKYFYPRKLLHLIGPTTVQSAQLSWPLISIWL